MSLVLRRVPFIRTFSSSPPHSARHPTVTAKPFSELPKRPLALPDDAVPTAHNGKTPIRRPTSESTAQGTYFCPPRRHPMPSLRPVIHGSTRPRRGRKPKSLSSAVPESIVSETGVSPKQPRNSLATEILTNLSRFPHCILLTRVGQFYEV